MALIFGMETSVEDAMMILTRWQQDGRLVQCGLRFEDAKCFMIGRIERITEAIVYITAASTPTRLGKQYRTEIPLQQASYQYTDPREAPKQFRLQIERTYDAEIAIILPSGLHASIVGLRPTEELLSL